MTNDTVIDLGFSNLDPQQLRRNFWGAVSAFVIGLALTFAGMFWVFSKATHATLDQLIAALWHQTFNFWTLPSVIQVQIATSLLAALAVGGLLFAQAFKPRDMLRHKAGRRYYEGNEAIQKAQRVSRREIKKQQSYGGILLNQNLRISRERETTHLLLTGGVGAGKTTILHHVIQEGMEREDAMIVADWKGDFTRAYHRPRILNPLDKRTVHWAIAKDVTNELEAQSFASQLIADPVGSADPFWANSARGVLTALIVKLIATRMRTWTWADLYREATQDVDTIIKTVQQFRPHAAAPIAGGKDSKQTQSVLAMMAANLDTVKIFAQAEAGAEKIQPFSIAEFLREGNKTKTEKQLILAGRVEHIHLSRAFMGAVLTLLTAKAQALPDSKARAIWFILDEFPRIGKLPCIFDLIAFGRSKGARVVLAVQDFDQLRSVYGQHDTDALLSMTGTQIIGRTAGGKTADQISRSMIGMRTFERLSVTTQTNGSRSSSFARDEIPVVHPSKLSELGTVKGGIEALLLGLGDTVLKLKWDFIAPPKKRRGFVLADQFKTHDQIVGEQPKALHELEGHDKGAEAALHQATEAVMPTGLGAAVEALGVLNELRAKQNTPTAAIHIKMALKKEQEFELEEA